MHRRLRHLDCRRMPAQAGRMHDSQSAHAALRRAKHKRYPKVRVHHDLRSDTASDGGAARVSVVEPEANADSGAQKAMDAPWRSGRHALAAIAPRRPDELASPRLRRETVDANLAKGNLARTRCPRLSQNRSAFFAGYPYSKIWVNEYF